MREKNNLPNAYQKNMLVGLGDSVSAPAGSPMRGQNSPAMARAAFSTMPAALPARITCGTTNLGVAGAFMAEALKSTAKTPSTFQAATASQILHDGAAIDSIFIVQRFRGGGGDSVDTLPLGTPVVSLIDHGNICRGDVGTVAGRGVQVEDAATCTLVDFGGAKGRSNMVRDEHFSDGSDISGLFPLDAGTGMERSRIALRCSR